MCVFRAGVGWCACFVWDLAGVRVSCGLWLACAFRVGFGWRVCFVWGLAGVRVSCGVWTLCVSRDGFGWRVCFVCLIHIFELPRQAEKSYDAP